MATEVVKDKALAPTTSMPKTPREALEQERALHPVFAVAAHLPTDIDTPFPVATPHTPTDEEKKVAAAKAALLKQIGDILKQYNNNESEVPATSEYWSLLGKYRGM